MHSAYSALIKKHPSAKLFITGYSLGGALATIAAMDLKEKFNPSNKMMLYTYGQPRVGNAALSDYIFSIFNQSNYIRIVNHDDSVPHQPAFSYKHAGTEVWYKSKNYDGKYVICENKPGHPESKACSDSIWWNNGVASHMTYVGVPMTMSCTRNQPAGTLASVEGEATESFI